KSTLGIKDDSPEEKKLSEISSDTTKAAVFVQSIKADALKKPSDFDIPEKIVSYLSSYIIPPKDSPDTGSSDHDSGFGNKKGGQTIIKTPTTIPTQLDNTVVPKEVIFTDVPVDYWGYEAIRYMNAKGAAEGYEGGMFLPNNMVTRAEFIQMIIKVFDPKIEITADFKNPFEDVTEEDWFANSIFKANILGVFFGSGASAEPNKQITKQEMAVLICRMAEKQGKVFSQKIQVSRFNDEADIAKWAYMPIMEMQAAGIISGDNGNFAPNNNATRAMAAQMLYKAMNNSEEKVNRVEGAE
ncbi:MAG: S-layer homology domain-containing protein, partial [Oscillospiraceae bacterium]